MNMLKLHLRYHLADVPPQSNSPPRNVLGADQQLRYATFIQNFLLRISQ